MERMIKAWNELRRPYWRLRIKTATKVGITLTILVLIVSTWTSIVPGFQSVDMTWVVFAALYCCSMLNSYHSPGVIRNIIDMSVAVFVSTTRALLTLLITRDNLWAGLPFLFFEAFIITAADRKNAHTLTVKISTLEYIALVFFTVPNQLSFQAEQAYILILVGHILPAFIGTLITAIIWPCFASTLILDEMIETLLDFKQYFNAISWHIFLVVKKSIGTEEIPNENEIPGSFSGDDLNKKLQEMEKEIYSTHHESYKDNDPLNIHQHIPMEVESMNHILLLEKKLNSHVLRLRKYTGDSSKETWYKEGSGRKPLVVGFAGFLPVVELALQKLVSMRIAVTKGEFIKPIGSDLLKPILPLFKLLENEVNELLDIMIQTLIHSSKKSETNNDNNNNNNNNNVNNDNNNNNNNNLNDSSRANESIEMSSVHSSNQVQQSDTSSQSPFGLLQERESNPLGDVSVIVPRNENSTQNPNQPQTQNSPEQHFLNNPTIIIRNPNEETLFSICKRIDQTYANLVVDYESHSKPVNPTSEVTRLSMFMFCATEFVSELHSISNLVKGYKHCRRSDIYRIVFIAAWLNILDSLKSVWNDFDLGIAKFFTVLRQGKLTMHDSQKNIVEYFKSDKWHFPFRVAFAVTSIVGIFLGIETVDSSGLLTPLWASTTCSIVLMPSLGATLSKGSFRFLGTLFGAVVGYFVDWIIMQAGGAGQFTRILPLVIFTFVTMFGFALLQQNNLFSYIGTVGLFTYQIMVLMDVNLDQRSPSPELEISRVAHILGGVLWALIISTFVLPYSAINNLGKTLSDSISTSGKAFSAILYYGLLNNKEDCAIDQYSRKVIEDTLTTLGSSILLQRTILSEAKPELMLLKKDKDFENALNSAEEVYLNLVSLYTAYGAGYSSEIKYYLVEPMRVLITDLLFPIDKLIRKVEENREKKIKKDFCRKEILTEEKLESLSLLGKPLSYLDLGYFNIRTQLAAQLRLGYLHTGINEMVHYSALLYSVREFITEWENLLGFVFAITTTKLEISDNELYNVEIGIISDDTNIGAISPPKSSTSSIRTNSSSFSSTTTGSATATSASPTLAQSFSHSVGYTPSVSRSVRTINRSPTQPENSLRNNNNKEKELDDMERERARLEEEIGYVRGSYGDFNQGIPD